MIPEQMNFFWGNDRMSFLRYLTLYSFRQLNPHWQMTLYQCRDAGITNKYWDCPNQQDFFAYDGQDYTEFVDDLDIDIVEWQLADQGYDVIGPSHLGDLFKWELMATEGGWYSDLDILYTSPMESYSPQTDDCDAALCCQHGHFSIGLLASDSENRFYQDVFVEALRSYNHHVYQSTGVESVYRVLGYTIEDHCDWWRLLTEKYPDQRFHNFPMPLVYPWRCTQMADVFQGRHTALPPATIGIHWYAGDPISQKFNGLMNHKNYHQFPSTISHFISQVLSV